jgi:hypothetical protein
LSRIFFATSKRKFALDSVIGNSDRRHQKELIKDGVTFGVILVELSEMLWTLCDTCVMLKSFGIANIGLFSATKKGP